MNKSLLRKRAGLLLLAVVAVGLIGYVLLKAGPLAPVQVSVTSVPISAPKSSGNAQWRGREASDS